MEINNYKKHMVVYQLLEEFNAISLSNVAQNLADYCKDACDVLEAELETISTQSNVDVEEFEKALLDNIIVFTEDLVNGNHDFTTEEAEIVSQFLINEAESLADISFEFSDKLEESYAKLKELVSTLHVENKEKFKQQKESLTEIEILNNIHNKISKPYVIEPLFK